MNHPLIYSEKFEHRDTEKMREKWNAGIITTEPARAVRSAGKNGKKNNKASSALEFFLPLIFPLPLLLIFSVSLC
jgi:hypothetical protein